ncbi:MAG: L,D-transpeptidase [Candidatus Pacebacteria bacterium]|nr:L,D-transpeptidase [Candidatus Paceibacterota bacterium]
MPLSKSDKVFLFVGAILVVLFFAVLVLFKFGVVGAKAATLAQDSKANTGAGALLVADTESSDPLFSKSSSGSFPEYIKVTHTCNWEWVGDCVIARTGPGDEYPHVTLLNEAGRLRNGASFHVLASAKAKDDSTWYQLEVSSAYGRIVSKWYVRADQVEEKIYSRIDPENDDIKNIRVNIGEQAIYFLEGDNLIKSSLISTGRNDSTPRGQFYISKKYPVRLMENLPKKGGLPYTYFVPDAQQFSSTSEGYGYYLHAALWHNDFGKTYSHGCINLPPDVAEWAYDWTSGSGTSVFIK